MLRLVMVQLPSGSKGSGTQEGGYMVTTAANIVDAREEIQDDHMYANRQPCKPHD